MSTGSGVAGHNKRQIDGALWPYACSAECAVFCGCCASRLLVKH